jgi:hypothetical protein
MTAVDSARKHRILGHQELRSYEEILDWIGTGKGPVIVGLSWYDRIANVKEIITQYELKGRSAGGHCVLFAGYSSRENGEPLIDMLNSHGKEYADGGWAAWTKKAIDTLCAQERGQNSIIGITDIQGFDPARLVTVGSRV